MVAKQMVLVVVLAVLGFDHLQLGRGDEYVTEPTPTVVEEVDRIYFVRELSWMYPGEIFGSPLATVVRERSQVFFVRDGQVLGPKSWYWDIGLAPVGDRFVLEWSDQSWPAPTIDRLVIAKSVHYITCDYRFTRSHDNPTDEWWRTEGFLAGNLALPAGE